MKNAEDFIIRTASILLIVVLITVYNHVLLLREKDNQIAQLNLQLETLKQQKFSTEADIVLMMEEENSSPYQDGVYQAEGQGFGGMILTEVKIENGRIHSVNILSHADEDEAYFAMAEELTVQIVENQSTELDAISGATFSSQGILEAVAQALEEAQNQT